MPAGDLTQVNAQVFRFRMMTTMTEDTLEIPRRRKASPDALNGRQAATLVRELNRQLGYWQGTSVKLHIMAERLTSSGRSDPAVGEQARMLLDAVSAEARRFETMVGAQPPTIAQHGRIKDTRRSFEMVAGRLRTCMQLLGVEPRQE